MLKSESSAKVNYFPQLLEKIKNRNACLGVVGIGYVGQPLAQAAARSGFKAIGFDIDNSKVEALNRLNDDQLWATTDFAYLANCDIISICVPTPIDEKNKPDLSCLEKAAINIAANLRGGQLVILESSVAPGTTKDFLLPILKKSNLIEGLDFFLAFSPERIDPGNKVFTLENTPKVVGGLEEQSLALVQNFYQNFIQKVIPVSKLEVAEMSKMLENTFRFVNINLVNELSEYAAAKNINIWEVIDAASTKPFAFMPHYPSAGIGGHCIPVDPYYLLNDAEKVGEPLKILDQVANYHETRPKKIVDKAISLLKGNGDGRAKQPIKILLIGIAYKPGSADTRESAALKIWEIAESRGAQVSYFDPHVPQLNGWNSEELTMKVLKQHDLIIIVTDHKEVPYDLILESGKPIIDTKNVYKDRQQNYVYKI